MNLHAPSKEGDERNYHAHLLVCTRTFDANKPEGLGNNVREFDSVTHQKAGTENHVEQWREKWEQQVNDALERADIREADGVTVATVNHQSHARRGLEEEPTIKEGTAATAKKRRGEPTDRAEQNAEIRERNHLADEIWHEAQELDVLMRRQAELMAAHTLKEAITPDTEPEPSAEAEPAADVGHELTPRRAQNIAAPQAERDLTASNDNAQPGEATPIKRFKGESDHNYQARVERIQQQEKAEADRAKEAPKLEPHYRPTGRGFRF